MPGYKHTRLACLNRLKLASDKKRSSKCHPCHPNVNNLNTASGLREAIMRVESRVDSLLRSTTCTSYGEEKIREVNRKIMQLHRDSDAYRRKLKVLQSSPPPCSPKPTHARPVDAVGFTETSLNNPDAMSVLPILSEIAVSNPSDSCCLVCYDVSDDEGSDT
ncbi:hypothetical protein FBUS_04256 [Fasciolopsis buskii]|uniref:Uncharacterized protein n=1 Tax=Fasciolopsis buskii TaxID=27845 RepID=A0A8E0VHN8_9TREM|nr:hypothetical protein FBUS_04256 [Fasciolopsis buski]